MKLRAWLAGPELADRVQLKKDIEALRKMAIPEPLVRRLLINYQIIMAEIFLKEKKYAEKDRSVKVIYDMYKSLQLNDADLVNLAKYFSHNSRFDWAEKILAPRVRSIDVSEDALFYYLNLSIFDKRNTKDPAYRIVMLNAINANLDRYCTLFQAIKNGGVSFQLLEDPYLRKTYCESCADVK